MEMVDLTNLPTVGGDEGTWGDENNAALLELDNKKASVANVYDKTTADARFVRTVNGVAPVDGNVVVAGGSGGGTGTVTAVGGIAPDGSGNVALTYDVLLGKPTIPTQASDVNAIPLASKGAASGVASLDASTKVPFAQVPTGTTSTTVAVGNHTHSVQWSWVPSGTKGEVYQNADGSWPDRPSSRTDISFNWVGTSFPPIGGGKAMSGRDSLDIRASS